jgi:hypothetical protein
MHHIYKFENYDDFGYDIKRKSTEKQNSANVFFCLISRYIMDEKKCSISLRDFIC